MSAEIPTLCTKGNFTIMSGLAAQRALIDQPLLQSAFILSQMFLFAKNFGSAFCHCL